MIIKVKSLNIELFMEIELCDGILIVDGYLQILMMINYLIYLLL